MGSSPEPRPSRTSESRKLVAEYEQSLKIAKEQHALESAESERRRKFRRPAILGGLLAIALYLSLFPPAWIKPQPTPPPSPQEKEAGDRFAIYLQAQRIEQYRNTTGRLPSTLEEAGEPIPGIRFELLGSETYALSSARDSGIRYTSSDSLRSFLGGSLEHLGRVQ